ncbi:hypothetical protein BSL78_29265 [Apostichopus japonicus]|uniref:Endonuclease/exonuclease/phosphatase domain-containing protein n=1 Tax=Stichopus japonicus TaxID=307972 RepID=A0A2G8JDU1_STIJA|nr:hypothetical protein BSL78_29265 [Apostichopus japonicus]
MSRVTYSRVTLMHLRQGVLIPIVRPFTPDEWCAATALGIVKVTKRGDRGGRLRKKFTIPTIVSQPKSEPWIINPPTRGSVVNLIRVAKERYNNNVTSRFVIWNAQSMKNKATAPSDLIIEQKLDIIAVTESWLCGGTDVNILYDTDSDHSAISCQIAISQPAAIRVTKTTRNLRDLAIPDFINDIGKSALANHLDRDLDTLALPACSITMLPGLPCLPP